jgi:hypothetical protein
MFSSGELITVYYALNLKYPKIGSLGLRDLVLKLILDDLKLLTLEEFVHFMATQVNNSKFTLFHTTYAELKLRLKEIAASSDPNLAANIFHLYVVTRIPFHRRKSRGIEHDINLEASQILNPLLEPICNNIPKMSINTVERLMMALGESSLINLNEIYTR